MTAQPANRAEPELATLVDRSVRWRFSLTRMAFIDLLLDRASTRSPSTTPVEYARRLSLDDLYLATSCARSDEDAWRECRNRYFDYIHAFARRFLDDVAAGEVADRIIGDLWCRERFTLYDGRSSLRTWLGTVVSNAAVNAGKAIRRTVALDLHTERHLRATQSSAASEDCETHETEQLFAGLVRRALAALDSDSKLLLLLYYEQGLTLDELESLMGASKATLSRRLQRIRGGLRDDIDGLAQRELRMDARAVRDRLDLGRLELDLSSVLRIVKDERRGTV